MSIFNIVFDNSFIIRFLLQMAITKTAKDLGKPLVHPMYLFENITFFDVQNPWQAAAAAEGPGLPGGTTVSSTRRRQSPV